MPAADGQMPHAGRRGGSRTLREARALVWRHRVSIGLGLVLMLINRLSRFALPWAMKLMFDRVVLRHRWDVLPILAIAVGAATLVDVATSFATARLLGSTAQWAVTVMRRRLQAHIMRLPVSFFDFTTTGSLISRIMTDTESVRALVGAECVQLIGSIVTGVVGFGILLYINWRLTAVILMILLVAAAGAVIQFIRLRPIFRQRGEITAQVTGRLGESLAGIRLVKAYTAERREVRLFTRGMHRLFRNVVDSLAGVSAMVTLSSVVINAIAIATIFMAAHAIRHQSMTIGDLIWYASTVAVVAMPVVQSASFGAQVADAFAGLDRICEIRKRPAENQDDGRRNSVAVVRGDVEFQDVTFEYEHDVPVLRHISLRAPAGSTTALVGSSGSGKSTLVSLVLAFNRPQSGQVLVDGFSLNCVSLYDYRAHVGVVLQDDFLFDGTIAENIAYSRPRASAHEIKVAGRLAHCDEFVDLFADGYDTVVGEHGVRLSGGQRQRVAIARAILADPAILVLDEATSSLDSESEALIQDALKSLRRGRTTFVIAHRLSTIRSADQILVLEAGEIIERGTHDDLLRLAGRYRQLYDRQYGQQHGAGNGAGVGVALDAEAFRPIHV